jgi:hypothetical protein
MDDKPLSARTPFSGGEARPCWRSNAKTFLKAMLKIQNTTHAQKDLTGTTTITHPTVPQIPARMRPRASKTPDNTMNTKAR